MEQQLPQPTAGTHALARMMCRLQHATKGSRDWITAPDQFFPPHELSFLDSDKLRELGDAIKAKVYEIDGRRFGTRNSSENRYHYACSRNGKPKEKALLLRDVQSQKCECKATFTVSASKVTFNLSHVDKCVRDGADDPNVLAYLQRLRSEVHSFDKTGGCSHYDDYLVALAQTQMKADLTLKPRNLSKQVIADIAKHTAIVGEPPEGVIKSIVRRGIIAHLESVNIKQSFQKMLDQLQESLEKGELTFQIRATPQGLFEAVFVNIKKIGPGAGHQNIVLTADVTVGLIDGRCGVRKSSFISTITPGHDVFPVVVSVIKHEDEATFRDELRFLIGLDPGIVHREVIFLVDGDRGRIAAIRAELPLARVYLCLWHKAENIQKHMGPVLNAHKAKTERTRAELMKELAAMAVPFKSSDSKTKLMQTLQDAVKAGLLQDVTNETAASAASAPVPSSLDEPAEDQDLGEVADEILLESERVGDDADPPQEEDESPAPPPAPSSSSSSASSSNAADPFPSNVKSFTKYTARQVFNWLRRASTYEEAIRRLDVLASTFVSLEGYVNGELKSTIEYWADWARVWGLTFGLVASTLQENIHWSLKSQLRGNNVFPHHFIEFVSRVMTKRQAGVEARRKSSTTLARYREDLPKDGLRAFVDVCSAWTTLASQSYLFAEMEEARRFAVVKLQTEEEVMRALPRGASAKRFSLLLRREESNIATSKYFLVKHWDVTVREEIVCVTAAGSIACSCGDVAEMGAPDRHVLAVYLEGHLAFSPKHHLHVAHKSPSVNSEGYPDAPVWHKCANCPTTFTADARWNEAVLFTETAWVTEGRGGHAVAAPEFGVSPSRKAKSSNLSKKEQFKKAFHALEASAQKDPIIMDRFLAFCEAEQARHAGIVGVTTIQHGGATMTAPPAQKRGTSKRIKSPAERGRGSKRSRGAPGGGRGGSSSGTS